MFSAARSVLGKSSKRWQSTCLIWGCPPRSGESPSGRLCGPPIACACLRIGSNPAPHSTLCLACQRLHPPAEAIPSHPPLIMGQDGAAHGTNMGRPASSGNRIRAGQKHMLLPARRSHQKNAPRGLAAPGPHHTTLGSSSGPGSLDAHNLTDRPTTGRAHSTRPFLF